MNKFKRLNNRVWIFLIIIFVFFSALFFKGGSLQFDEIKTRKSVKDINLSSSPLVSNSVLSDKLFSDKKSVTEFSKMNIQEKICDLKKRNSQLKLTSDSELVMIDEVFNDVITSVFYIFNRRCPSLRYSILQISDQGEILNYKDCESVSEVDLMRQTHFQFNLEPSYRSEESFDLALVGPGYFVVFCPLKGGMYVTRKGDFNYFNGLLVNSDDCYLAETKTSILGLRFKESINQDGCFEKQKKCIATIDLRDYSSSDFEYIDSNYLKFAYTNYGIDELPKYSKNTQIHQNFVENRPASNIDDYGMPQWDTSDLIQMPTCE